MSNLKPPATRTQLIWDALTLAGAALLVFGAFASPAQFFPAYLIAFVFWIGITLGCFIVLMITRLAGGNWGLALRRVLEAASQTSPVMAILVVPLVFGLPTLYAWANPAVVAGDPLLQAKSVYLNVPFFIARTLLYIIVWNLLIYRGTQWGKRQERPLTPEEQLGFRRFSAVALVVFGLTVTFAGVDYLMSLEPHWYSSVYSAMVAAGGVLSGFAFAICVVTVLRRREAYAMLVTPQALNDMGNLLIAFVMIWAYLAYSQFLIIWAGNLSEEITWYLRRTEGGWEWAAMLAVGANFVLPFILLLFRDVKRSALLLGMLAGWLALAHAVDVFWLVKPVFAPALSVSALDVLAFLVIGSVWLFVFRRQLARRPLVPLVDALSGTAQPVAARPGYDPLPTTSAGQGD